MNLLDQPAKQVEDCILWMRDVAGTGPPSPQIWAEVQEGLREHALFLEAFVVSKIMPVSRHLFEGKEIGTRSETFKIEPPLPPVPALETSPFLGRNGRQEEAVP